MNLQELFDDKFQVVAAMDGDSCPVLAFLLQGEASTEASRQGLLEMLMRVAELGFQGIPSKWTHEANKQEQIYEFVKGDLRLFFFKGAGRQVAVCTAGVMKKGQKADKGMVNLSASIKSKYFSALQLGTLKVITNEDD